MATDQERAISWLKLNVMDGDRIYGIVHSTGKGQVIQLLWVSPGRVIEDVTNRVARATGLKLMQRGLYVPGTGFNHVGAAVERVAAILGITLKHEQISVYQS